MGNQTVEGSLMLDRDYDYITHPQREKRIRQAIESLTEQRRAEMAVLILAGYKFVLGRVYWYCDTPQGGRCSTLDALHDCIRAALAHHTEATLDRMLYDA